MIELKIGCDPELWIKDGEKIIPAYNLIPGTKEEPHKVNKGAIQVDGLATEFNIEPATSPNEFVTNIGTVMEALKGAIPRDCTLDTRSVAYFDSDVFDCLPQEALELGCEPDYNAYTGKVNAKPRANKKFRTAGGHIHIGWTEGVNPYDAGHLSACKKLVKALDFSIGGPLAFLEGNNKRRSLYAKAGSYRPKSYGVEYRVPSPIWLQSERSIACIFKKIKETFQELVRNNGESVLMKDLKISESEVREFINNGGSEGYFTDQVRYQADSFR